MNITEAWNGNPCKMRVLLLPSSYSPVLGGLQTVTHTLARYLIQRNHQVRVITNRYPRFLAGQELIEDVHVRRLMFIKPLIYDLKRRRPDLFFASFFFFPYSLFRMIQLFKKFCPNVVNVHFPDCQIPFVLWLRKRFAFRLVVSLHGHEIMRWFENNNRQGVPDKLRTILQQADAVTACSRHLLDKTVELEPLVADKGYVIHNGIDVRRFRNRTIHSHPRPYIFAFGRLTRHKGFDMLLTAFAQNVKLRHQFDLVLAGDGEERQNLQYQIKQMNLGNHVHLYGLAKPGEVVKLLNGCELVVIPSRSESFGITALEAMAAGKPVLATRVGGLPEFAQGSANQLVEPTIKGISKGLQAWLEQRDKMKFLAVQNRYRAAEFTWEKMVDRYLELYQNCA